MRKRTFLARAVVYIYIYLDWTRILYVYVEFVVCHDAVTQLLSRDHEQSLKPASSPVKGSSRLQEKDLHRALASLAAGSFLEWLEAYSIEEAHSLLIPIVSRSDIISTIDAEGFLVLEFYVSILVFC